MSYIPPNPSPSQKAAAMEQKTQKFTPTDGRPLTPYEREILTILQEECAEVIVAASKLLRFGLGNTNPDTKVINTTELGLELGDLQHMMRRVEVAGIVDIDVVLAGDYRKERRLAQFLQTGQSAPGADI